MVTADPPKIPSMSEVMVRPGAAGLSPVYTVPVRNMGRSWLASSADTATPPIQRRSRAQTTILWSSDVILRFTSGQGRVAAHRDDLIPAGQNTIAIHLNDVSDGRVEVLVIIDSPDDERLPALGLGIECQDLIPGFTQTIEDEVCGSRLHGHDTNTVS